MGVFQRGVFPATWKIRHEILHLMDRCPCGLSVQSTLLSASFLVLILVTGHALAVDGLYLISSNILGSSDVT